MSDNREANQPGFFFADSGQIHWRASSMAAGVEVKDLGTADGRSMQLVRFPPGTVFPVHEHAGPEFVYVVEGELIQNGRRLGQGWVSVANAGTVDRDVKSETGCVFLIIYSE
jgi:anti-sigma factor ChrR (cupin superfamily)